jgi:hypothetical protein
MSTPRTYTCAVCKGTFQSGWTEEEAKAECIKDFGALPPEEHRAVLCEDCYQKVRPDLNPSAIAAWIRERN